MKCSAWKGGSYGVRVGRANAQQYFNKSWNGIEVNIGGIWHTFSLTTTFWSTCPEFRGKRIKAWLKTLGLIPWKPGRPPRLTLKHKKGKKFLLSYP